MLVLLAAALVAATALLVSARLADGSVVQLLVGAYTIAFAEIVLVSLGLSIGSNLDRTTLIASLAGILCVAAVTSRGVRFPPFRPAARSLLAALRDPPVAAVALVVAGVVVYSTALALFTPENELDALGYHLTRAAFWRQQDGIGHIDGAADARLNEFPPNSEIVTMFTLIASGSGRFAGFVQLTAMAATLVAVYGIARRFGVGVRAAVFGALLFGTTPAVALQASTSLNDVVLASHVAGGAFFLLGASWPNLLLAGLAVALVVGTKLTGLLALPALGLLAVAARKSGRLAAVCVVTVAAAVGAYWYVVNLVEAGDPVGDLSNEGVGADPVAAVSRVVRLALASIELPGAPGLDRFLYVGAAAALGGALLLGGGSLRRRAARAAVAAAAVLAPLAAVEIGDVLVRGYLKLFYEIGREDVGYLDPNRSPTKASPIFSWYGPVGVLLTLLSSVLVYRAVRRRTLRRVALLAAAAPAIWIVLLGLAVPYWEWNGRYAMAGFALAAATWGTAYHLRPIAWAAAAVAALTSGLAFVHLHDKPAGVRLLEPTDVQSVWTQPEWMVQGTSPQMRALIRFVDANVPGGVRLAVAPTRVPGVAYRGGNVEPFPFFGKDLSRTLVFATTAERAREAMAEWAILHRTRGCVPGWDRAFVHGGWEVLRRSPRSACPASPTS